MDALNYADRLMNYVAGGYLSMALCLGNDLGIIEALKNAKRPMSIKELAKECSLKERYTEEWLGAMVAAQVVYLDDKGSYFIPEECKDSLGMAVYAGGVPCLGLMYRNVMNCFKSDGPPGFEWGSSNMIDSFKDWTGKRLMNTDIIANEILAEVKKLKGKTNSWLEIGCGKGSIALELHQLLPDSKILATDYDSKVIKDATEKQKNSNLGPNLEYQVQNVEKLPKEWSNKFDIVLLYDVLHDLPNPEISTLEVKRVLANDGIAIFVDPGMHSDHKDNVGDLSAGMGLSISSFICLPSSLSSGGPGYGIGWGIERKRDLLHKLGFIIQSEAKISNNVFALSVYCKKN